MKFPNLSIMNSDLAQFIDSIKIVSLGGKRTIKDYAASHMYFVPAPRHTVASIRIAGIPMGLMKHSG